MEFGTTVPGDFGNTLDNELLNTTTKNSLFGDNYTTNTDNNTNNNSAYDDYGKTAGSSTLYGTTEDKFNKAGSNSSADLTGLKQLVNDNKALLGLAGAGSALLSGSGAKKTGYQGGIPNLVATRNMITAPPVSRRAGAGGINYGGDVAYSLAPEGQKPYATTKGDSAFITDPQGQANILKGTGGLDTQSMANKISYNLPGGWDKFSGDQKISWFNQNNVTYDQLRAAGVPQSDIDYMWSNGYTSGRPADWGKTTTAGKDTVTSGADTVTGGGSKNTVNTTTSNANVKIGNATTPADWGTYDSTKKINWFNTNSITPAQLLEYGVPQSDIDYMWTNGYTVGRPADWGKTKTVTTGTNTVTSGADTITAGSGLDALSVKPVVPTVVSPVKPGATTVDPTVDPFVVPPRTSCPAPDMRILLANGDLKPAGELQVGDVVKTQHENTLAWGKHPVTHVSIVPNALRLKFIFDDGEFVCSLDHKFFKSANEWITAKDVVLEDMLSGKTVRHIEQTATGDVVRITIDDAHTYICEGLLSHNKSPLQKPQSEGLMSALGQGLTEEKYISNIKDWLTKNSTASDAEVRAQMDSFGISPADVARALGGDASKIQDKYNSAFTQGTAQQKADAYNMLLKQGLTNDQIRASIEKTTGKQTDADWSYLQDLAKTPPKSAGGSPPAPPVVSGTTKSAGLMSALEQGMGQDKYISNIKDFLNKNNTASDAEIYKQMQQYGIGAEDVASALGVPVSTIQGKIQALQQPGGSTSSAQSLVGGMGTDTRTGTGNKPQLSQKDLDYAASMKAIGIDDVFGGAGANAGYIGPDPEVESRSSGMQSALDQGMDKGQYIGNIKDWLTKNSSASDAEVFKQMKEYGIGAEDVASALGVPVSTIQNKINALTQQGDIDFAPPIQTDSNLSPKVADQSGGIKDIMNRQMINSTLAPTVPSPDSEQYQTNNQSSGMQSALKQGMSEDQYIDNIKGWLTQNSTASDAEVFKQMKEYGIGMEDVARALGVPVSVIQNKIDALGGNNYASGGMAKGRYLQGGTDGMADKIPAQIGEDQPAALSHGEFVIPADVVSHMGNGNSDAGAKKLYQMMDRIRMARTGNKDQGKKINPDKFMPGGLASAYANGGFVKHFAGGGTTLPTGTIGSESNLSNWAGDYTTNMLGQGQALANMPYQAYMGPLTAGPSALQNKVSQGLEGINFPGTLGQSFTSSAPTGMPTMPTDMGTYTPQKKADLYNQFRGQGYGDQAIRQAAGTQTDTDWQGLQDMAAKSGPINIPQQQGIAGSYMNPYLQNVLQPQLAELNRQSQINLQPSLAKLTSAGGYGGGRQAIMESESNRNLLNAQNTAIGQGYSNAYDKGMQQFNTEQGQAKTLADMMAGQGAVNRGIESEGVAADKAAFEEARANPYKMVQYQQSLLQGLPLAAQSYQGIEPTALVKAAQGATSVNGLLKALGLID